MSIAAPELEILLPVHNEAESIERTIREIYDTISPYLRLRFLICEDGSVDDTKRILRGMSESLPMKLILGDQRKGYSRAVKDGMQAAEAPYLLCLDSDGQCDPRDFALFWENRKASDILVGWRLRRQDSSIRKLWSRAYYRIYRLFFAVPVHDPSCPYLLVRSEVAQELATGLGSMQQGCWWEFIARANRRGFSIREIPVNHRRRLAGATKVYRLGRLPGIGWRHCCALASIWWETRSGRRKLKSDPIS
jgi:dolichol-phosphate mannosyltransferase